MKPIIIEAKPYMVDVHCFICKREQMLAWFWDMMKGDRQAEKEYYSLADHCEDCGGYAFYFYGDNGDYNRALWIPTIENSLVLNHEMLHTAMDILNRAGIDYRHEQEALCYLHGQLVWDLKQKHAKRLKKKGK